MDDAELFIFELNGEKHASILVNGTQVSVELSPWMKELEPRAYFSSEVKEILERWKNEA